MKEEQFKQLEHQFGSLRPAAFGSKVCEGYRPDLVLFSNGNQVVFIIEVETTPSRKTLVGDLTKAEKFCEDGGYCSKLLIVLTERPNTTKNQIASHLNPYLDWFKSKRTKKAGVSDVLIITDEEYKTSVSCEEVFGGPQFTRRCLHVSRT